MNPATPMRSTPKARPLRFSRLWRLGRTYLGSRPLAILVYVVGSLCCDALLPPAVALRFGRLTNISPSAHSDPNATYRLYFQWMGLSVALLLLVVAVRYFTTILDAGASNRLRRDAFGNLMRLGPAYFQRHDPGELTMVINQVCLTAEIGLRQLLIDPLIQGLSACTIGYALYSQLADARAHGQGTHMVVLFGIVAAVAVFFLQWVRLIAPRLQRAGSDLQQQYLLLSSFVGAAVSAPEEIQSMGAESLFAEKHARFLQENLRLQKHNAFTLESLNLLNQTPGNLLLFSFLGAAVYFGTRNSNTQPGTLVSLVLLTPGFMGAVQSIGSWRIVRSQAWPALSLVAEILTIRNPETVLPAPVAAESVQASSDESVSEKVPTPPQPDSAAPAVLRVEGLTFSYDPGSAPNVLDSMDFAPPPGKITALVSRPGAGKTTFFQLALRFYDAQRGTIAFNGVAHTTLDLAELRRRVMLTSRTPVFFQESLRENLRLARPDATDEQLRAVCELTGLWPTLKDQFGSDGNLLDAAFHAGDALSGAQKKLFALTRCLLREPECLFLDEPTTGVEHETKFDLIAPMRAGCAGKTVVVVDHDLLWQLRFCDYFAVLDGGKIAEQGTGRELLDREGVFRQLFDEQTSGLIKLLRTLQELDLPAHVTARYTQRT